jgi:hypothetical protein
MRWNESMNRTLAVMHRKNDREWPSAIEETEPPASADDFPDNATIDHNTKAASLRFSQKLIHWPG